MKRLIIIFVIALSFTSCATCENTIWICPSCGKTTNTNYCPECGIKRPDLVTNGNAPASVTIHYTNENGHPLLPDQTLILEQGIHSVSAQEIEGCFLISPSSFSVTVDDGFAYPSEITFAYVTIMNNVDETPTVPDINDLGKWTINYYVDRFGDKTGKKYITTLRDIDGTFSNSATTNSELKARILIDRNDTDLNLKKCTRIAIILYEYEKNQVKSSYDRSFRIYVRDSNGEKTSSKGSLYGDRVYIDSWGYDKDNKHNKGPGLEKILNALYRGGEVKFVLEEENSTSSYVFTIDASKFGNAYYNLIMEESKFESGNEPDWAKEMRKNIE